MPDYERIDVANVTPRTAPPYGMITFTERNSSHVLADGQGGEKLLIGKLGVNYVIERSDHEAIYLRRADQPPSGNDPVTIHRKPGG